MPPYPRRPLLRCLILPLLAACCALAAPVRAENPTSGDIVLFPGDFFGDVWPASPASTQSAGHGIHLPGRRFRPGSGWWVLACEAGCMLSTSTLSVQPLKHAQYDGDPLDSQGLFWNPLPAGIVPQATPPTVLPSAPVAASLPPAPKLIAVFKPIRSLTALNLAAGPVKTWLHAGMPAYPRPPGEGTMETLIRMDGGRSATLLPRLKPASGAPGQDGDEVLIELRADGKRQRLGGFEFDMGEPHSLAPRDYLLWAGDLDGDGRLDLLVRLAERGWNVALYLSSRAAPGELVGEAGRFQYFDPSDPGC